MACEQQDTISSALREQVLAALRELLRGIDHADHESKGAVLAGLREERLQEVYTGLLTALMRMVFLLLAEDRSLLPMENDLYARNHSLAGLYDRLLEGRSQLGDGIDQRYEAWPRITALFRLIHDGAKAGDGLRLPAHGGQFFCPDAFPFLEGRPQGPAKHTGETAHTPHISDGIVLRVLEHLLVVGQERIRYRDLDVEQIGSVYEGLSGFRLEVAAGESLWLASDHVVNLDELLRMSGPARLKTLKAAAGLQVNAKTAAEVKDAKTIEGLQAALARRLSVRGPARIAKGSLYLQPSDERRKSGSHYTPSSLTGPIVKTALRPVLEGLGPEVTPERLLGLKLCDPAMGSGAFLVETCRQLACHLVEAWRRTGTTPALPPAESLDLHARRLIARRCLYGVDKNPVAVELARLSIWLVTSAKDYPFTFVDHALRAGDSLVGLSQEQIACLSLDVGGESRPIEAVRARVMSAVGKAEAWRRESLALGDSPLDEGQRAALVRRADDVLDDVRRLADWLVATFFAADSDKARNREWETLAANVVAWLETRRYDEELRARGAHLRQGSPPLLPFHWEIEFPEVFKRQNAGFDCVVGNPPFLGGKRISTVLGTPYRDWLSRLHEGSSSNTDLSAHFYRRAFSLMAPGGCFGLIATNTISQGDTRSSGLRWLCAHGGTIYAADRRVEWPGEAMVVVSVVHLAKGFRPSRMLLNGKEVANITAFLYARGGHDDPLRLRANANRAFIGCFIRGKGFIFDDAEEEHTPLATMRTILARDPSAAQIIRPFIGGEEVLNSPTHAHHRYIIRFGARDEAESRRWHALYRIIDEKVRPYRQSLSDTAVDRAHKRKWWCFANDRPELYAAIANRKRVLVIPRVSQHLCVAFLPADMVFSDQLVVLPHADHATFALLSSSVHHDWTRALASTLGDGLRYTPSDCFETFPFPLGPASASTLERAGRAYQAHRARIMIERREALTKTYGRFHDPEERSADICRLRDLHADMDRAVLDAYGWTDIRPAYDFRQQLDENVRLTWGEDTHDEVLARLLERNREMAEREA